MSARASEMYQQWLLECVYVRGMSTLWCANQIGADPEEVRKDLESAIVSSMDKCTSCDGYGGIAFVGSTGPGIPCGRCRGTGKAEGNKR